MIEKKDLSILCRIELRKEEGGISMGHGWRSVPGGLYNRGKCKCGKGEVIIYVSNYEESDYPPFEREDVYTGETTCPDNCVNIEKMSNDDLKFYKR